MIKAHQIRLYPTKSQEVLLRKSCGVARYSYNWALSKWKELYENGEKPSAYSLIKLQNSIKRDEMPFFLEVSKTAPQYAIHNLEKAFKRFLAGIAKFPKYKKKGVKDSFVAVENRFNFNQSDFKIHLQRIGKVKCAENLRFDGKVNYVTVKRIANMWFAVINVEIAESTNTLKQIEGENQAIIGVDLGIKSMMVLSDGTVFDNPNALKKNLKRVKRLQRKLNKKQKGSKNRRKQQVLLARLHYKISCIRSNAIHQATSSIAKKYDKIVIEDLSVKSMIKNRNLSQAISDVSFGEITSQLVYKALINNKEIVKADRFFASSKTCSCCGHKKEQLKLSERIFICEVCGFTCDRDLNAAKNLAKYSPTLRLSESEACGERSSCFSKSLSMNQEIKPINNKEIFKINVL